MRNSVSNKLLLKNASNIAVVGGGPSGSFFSFLALKMAKEKNLSLNIDIFEAKDFNRCGASGCNHCGGILSESLLKMLFAEGIELPSEVIRRKIESYTLHSEQGSTEIEAPKSDQKIISMFRGRGPQGCITNGQKGFDQHLLELCQMNGANVIYDKVIEAERSSDGIKIRTLQNFHKEYDFVVGAIGLNKRTFDLFHNLCPSFIPPRTTQTFIGEIQLEEKLIDKHLGKSMHVFLLNLPNIKFGALIPKGNFVTLVLLGENIDQKTVDQFLQTDEVEKCFPADMDFEKTISCRCYPYINIKGSKIAYADRVLLVGDSSTSKLYKNGIGAAFITAKAAAETAILHGISQNDIKKYYIPTCNKLKRDNKIGRFIFSYTSILQRSKILKRALHNMLISEQKLQNQKRKSSSILWDTFTGSAPYKDIFIRILNPKIILQLMWYTIKAFSNLFK